ncbi:MAG: DUF389 domain-containing protein, partial [Saprospiraceae bacterium]|nr:DUF389 domain-containing protein [Saprospiraceae bacterium]
MQPPKENPGFPQSIRTFFRKLIDLEAGLDREGTVFEIRANCKMQGANAWMLMCSIMIASLGLDLNSPAVIIGAMLISPLMAPILGVGLGIGTSDHATIGISLRHFAIAIGIALFTSTLYFLITPLGTVTPEILARTEPTILDVAIAVFGGVAGIISASRKDKSNAIPGVAIATALMPPLCVSGYGLATGNMSIALSSFYLFFLNSFFVALATYAIVRFLHFPTVNHIDARDRKKQSWIIFISSLVMIIPSAFILVGVIRDIQESHRVDNFVRSHFADYMKYIDAWDYVHADTTNTLILKVYGSEIDDYLLTNYQSNMARFGLENTRGFTRASRSATNGRTTPGASPSPPAGERSR